MFDCSELKRESIQAVGIICAGLSSLGGTNDGTVSRGPSARHPKGQILRSIRSIELRYAGPYRRGHWKGPHVDLTTEAQGNILGLPGPSKDSRYNVQGQALLLICSLGFIYPGPCSSDSHSKSAIAFAHRVGMCV